MLAKHWLVMDMDGTVVPTPTKGGGQYLSLSHSPCKPQLIRWLKLGGSLCIVSTAGRRMWRQVYEELQPTLFPEDTAAAAATTGRLVVGGMSGAALYATDAASGTLREDLQYRENGFPGGTVIPTQHVGPIRETCFQVLKTLFTTAMNDATLLPMLSKKYHSVYGDLIDQLRTMGHDKFFTEVVNMESAFIHGKFLKESNDALIDTQTLPGTEDAPGGPVVVQFGVLGVPMKRFDEFFTPALVDHFKEEFGVFVKRQPNSVAIAKHGISKTTTVDWLVAHPDKFDSFALKRSIAFGDFPGSVDKPLTEFPPMPFVSVSLQPENDPPGLVHVGSEEEGTAVFMDELMTSLEARAGSNAIGADGALWDRAFVEAAGAAAKARLSTDGKAAGTSAKATHEDY